MQIAIRASEQSGKRYNELSPFQIGNFTNQNTTTIMREIKFKGQRSDDKEWVYGFLTKCQNRIWENGQSSQDGYKIQIISHEMPIGVWDVIPETVGQYTGRNDKNGKEIYVGDIMGKGPLTCIVKQREDGAYILQFLDPVMKGIDISILDPKVANSEITGNIHEFPGLLTKLKQQS
ncbi:YopX family protein [Chryseobacterium gallinarum]|uniref:YopX protein domain-containing protein n=1 Tax=Chryseobacterium gallinarum TaxID=1324352 RepID=A0ABX6KUQ2_CHRGL|nr:YopX family protein [Chryseobacterium gallinarum]QIY92217.1 hypothetical protein FOB44_16795 [Chryseobacterium gallinarum]